MNAQRGRSDTHSQTGISSTHNWPTFKQGTSTLEPIRRGSSLLELMYSYCPVCTFLLHKSPPTQGRLCANCGLKHLAFFKLYSNSCSSGNKVPIIKRQIKHHAHPRNSLRFFKKTPNVIQMSTNRRALGILQTSSSEGLRSSRDI